MSQIYCTNHCSACDCHFSSVAAFDKHRVKGQCRDPKKRKPLHVKTDAGLCELQTPMVVLEGVTVWTDAKP